MAKNDKYKYVPDYVDKIIKSYPYISNRAFERYRKDSEKYDLADAMDQLQAMYSNHQDQLMCTRNRI